MTVIENNRLAAMSSGDLRGKKKTGLSKYQKTQLFNRSSSVTSNCINICKSIQQICTISQENQETLNQLKWYKPGVVGYTCILHTLKAAAGQ